jgi:hypothetical protein
LYLTETCENGLCEIVAAVVVVVVAADRCYCLRCRYNQLALSRSTALIVVIVAAAAAVVAASE